MTPPLLALVVPVYNESGAIQNSSQQLLKILVDLTEKELISPKSRLVFIDDGSRDNTWELICELAKENKSILGLHFGANQGQQNAILAGYFEVPADAYISLDVDLQDDISKIKEMVLAYHSGKDVVYGVRNNRSTDSFFKRSSAALYYKTMSLLGVKMIPQHSEFRLISRRGVDILNKQYPERNLFLRATILALGLPSEKIYYKRQKRTAGKSKYNFIKLFRLMIDGLTSYSTQMLNLIVIGALIFIGISFVIFIYIAYFYFSGRSISGWASILGSLYFVGGCIMASLAILAEYISRIYTETKRRPHYIITASTSDLHQDDKTHL